ncbi:3',5'-cyclic adenosine monophosphate phosphodiesterase CpdA [uncultured archaeon]|nr:3',5'-cyclic adenosine monophosphate phosphodiesterase CpdA [uncultured archaeon]
MNLALRYTIFSVVVLALSLGLHYWLLNSIYTYFDWNMNVAFHIVVFCLAIIFPLGMTLQNAIDSKLTRTIYWFASAWLGCVILVSAILLTTQIISLIFFIPEEIKGLVVIASFFLCVCAFLYARMIKIVRYTLKSSKIKKNLRIVHLSDLHIGPIYRESNLKKIVQITNSLKPDLVAITGDLLDGTARYRELDLLKPLNNLKAPAYFVFGNHDFYSGEEKVLRLLKATKTKILRSKLVETKGIQLIGIDDSENKHHAPAELKKIKFDKKKYSILLYHRPQGLNKCSEEGIDLILSGHTHGGQLYPLILIDKLFNEYVKGMHQYKNTKIIVSQGVNTWGPPMRMGSQSQIIEINLQPQ